MAAKGSSGDAGKVTGPASYFPSIEPTYIRPITAWQALIRGIGIDRHMELGPDRLRRPAGVAEFWARVLGSMVNDVIADPPHYVSVDPTAPRRRCNRPSVTRSDGVHLEARAECQSSRSSSSANR
jgi:hypothetical protein